MDSTVDRFFGSLSEPQRKLLASLSGEPSVDLDMLGHTLVSKAKAMEARAQAVGGSEAVLACIEQGGGTGPAFAAFGRRAVALKYMSQDQLDAVAVRLARIQDPGDREAAVVVAIRRFLCKGQPLGTNIRVQPICKPFRNGRGKSFDLNGLELQIDCCAPPGGDPERYNVLCEEDENGDEHVLQIEPKYLRPCPLEVDLRDPNHAPIPEDHAAEAWWHTVLQKHAKIQMLGFSFGPSRPSGPAPS